MPIGIIFQMRCVLMLCLSNEDMDPKNIMWDIGIPWIITFFVGYLEAYDISMQEYTLKLDYYSLLNLHKALLEAKFHTMPDKESVAGSPLVAELYIQVCDLLIESDKGSEWKDWFQLSNRPDRKEQAIILMRRNRIWNKATHDEKNKIANAFLAPFIFSEEELESVIEEVDSSDTVSE